jgi:hypothetical protein
MTMPKVILEFNLTTQQVKLLRRLKATVDKHRELRKGTRFEGLMPDVVTFPYAGEDRKAMIESLAPYIYSDVISTQIHHGISPLGLMILAALDKDKENGSS